MSSKASKEILLMLEESKKLSVREPFKAYQISKKAYNMAREMKLKPEEGHSLLGMAYACRVMSKYSKALLHSFTALEIFKKINDLKGQIRAFNIIGIIYFYFSQYTQALEKLLDALKLLETAPDCFLLSCVLNNIGEVYKQAGNFDNALKHYERALEVCEKNNFRDNIARIFSNIGDVYFNKQEYDKAKSYFAKSYNIVLEECDTLQLAELEKRLGKIESVNKNFDKARNYYFSAIDRLKKIHNKYYLIDVFIYLGDLEINLNESTGLEYYIQAYKYAEEINAMQKISQVSDILAQYYEQIGSYKKSLDYFKKHHYIEQEIEASNLTYKLEMMKIEFKHFKAKNQLENFKKINQRLETEINNERSKLEQLKQINEKLREKSLIDELTGIPNRRSINNYLKKFWNVNKEKNIAIFMIDIDRFKEFNDYWGHIKGDKCLVEIAKSLKNIQMRRNDFLGRYGGEEFIYIAEVNTYEEVFEIGNSLKDAVENLRVEYDECEKYGSVTISLGGVYGCISDFKSISSAIEIADKELYRAKSLGRNKLCINKMTG